LIGYLVGTFENGPGENAAWAGSQLCKVSILNANQGINAKNAEFAQFAAPATGYLGQQSSKGVPASFRAD
jgi:hypothetical protein